MYGKIKNGCLTQGQPKMKAIFCVLEVRLCFIFSPVKRLPEMLFPTSVKTVKRKVKIYYEILKTLNSDQYNNVIMAMRDINERGDGITYVLPECECEYCKSKISEVETDPLQMLFTRHRLGVIGNL